MAETNGGVNLSDPKVASDIALKAQGGHIQRVVVPYAFVEFPKVLYKAVDDLVQNKIVGSAEHAAAALEDGWVEHPSGKAPEEKAAKKSGRAPKSSVSDPA